MLCLCTIPTPSSLEAWWTSSTGYVADAEPSPGSGGHRSLECLPVAICASVAKFRKLCGKLSLTEKIHTPLKMKTTFPQQFFSLFKSLSHKGISFKESYAKMTAEAGINLFSFRIFTRYDDLFLSQFLIQRPASSLFLHLTHQDATFFLHPTP